MTRRELEDGSAYGMMGAMILGVPIMMLSGDVMAGLLSVIIGAGLGMIYYDKEVRQR